MRTTTSCSLGLAAAAVAATGSTRSPPAVAASAAAASAPSAPGASATSTAAADQALERSAVAAPAAHPGAARVPGDDARVPGEQQLRVTDTVLDEDGASHVGLERTCAGLPVRGGDVVVHQGPGAAWEVTAPTYAGARTTTRRAVTDLDGVGGAERAAVAAAWTAVGLG